MFALRDLTRAAAVAFPIRFENAFKGGTRIQEFSKQTPLPVTIVADMTVVPIDDALTGIIRGITETYCIYQLPGSERHCVAAWPELALAHVCPAPQLLPADVTEADRQNASAAVLRELLLLEQFGLSTTQKTAKDELLNRLCPEHSVS